MIIETHIYCEWEFHEIPEGEEMRVAMFDEAGASSKMVKYKEEFLKRMGFDHDGREGRGGAVGPGPGAERSEEETFCGEGVDVVERGEHCARGRTACCDRTTASEHSTG